MLAQSLYPHRFLQNLNTDELQQIILVEKGINWNDLDRKFKGGTYLKNVKISRNLSISELSELPVKHNICEEIQI